MVPRSSTGSVVSPTPDSPEVDPAEVELLPALEPVLSTAVVSPVDPAGIVVISGVLEKPDELEVGAWQAPSMASSISRGRRGLMACGRVYARHRGSSRSAAACRTWPTRPYHKSWRLTCIDLSGVLAVVRRWGHRWRLLLGGGGRNAWRLASAMMVHTIPCRGPG